MKQMIGMAKHFHHEIGEGSILLRILKIYILPHIDYCSPIWHNDKITKIKELDKMQIKITSIILVNPRINHPPSIRDRIIHTSAVNLYKIIKAEMYTTLTIETRTYIQEASYETRNPNYFKDNINRLSVHNPLRIAANYIEKLKQEIELDMTGILK